MRKSMYVVLALVAGVLVWSFVAQTTAQVSGVKEVPPGFGKKVAGCFLNEVWIGPEEDYHRAMATFTADGAVLYTPDQMFGFGDPEADLYAPAHGTWVRTGPREIEAVIAGMGFDKDGNQIFTWKVWVPIEFDEAFRFGIVEEYPAAAYLPEQDWTDPDEVPVFEWTGFGQFKKLVLE